MPLYIVATPIGNLEDLSLRALRILKEIDLVATEDTRQAQKLLGHFGLKKPLFSLNQHASDNKLAEILDRLKNGQNVAYISDAGTPNISDPGGHLVEYINREELDIPIIPIPGASALATAISVAGIQLDKFLFLGFLPHKKGRETLLKKIKSSEYPVILYESKHRLIKLLTEIAKNLPPKKIIIFKELTKIHEQVLRGSATELIAKFKSSPVTLKGEFTVIIYD